MLTAPQTTVLIAAAALPEGPQFGISLCDRLKADHPSVEQSPRIVAAIAANVRELGAYGLISGSLESTITVLPAGRLLAEYLAPNPFS